jgi:transcription initiation factor TFIID TATA-box-binding protein
LHDEGTDMCYFSLPFKLLKLTQPILYCIFYSDRAIVSMEALCSPPLCEVPMPKPSPFIHNIVATAQILTSAPLQLDRLKQIFRFSSFNRRKFAAVTLRLVRPNCTILLFTSGKLVITGSKSSSEALLSAYRIRQLLRSACIGQRFEIIGFEIQNVVSHCELKVSDSEILDIEALYERYHIYSTYQSHVFPGLIFRHPNLKVVALMFFSGKVVLTGAKSLKDIDDGWDVIFTLLKPYVVKRQ